MLMILREHFLPREAVAFLGRLFLDRLVIGRLCIEGDRQGQRLTAAEDRHLHGIAATIRAQCLIERIDAVNLRIAHSDDDIAHEQAGLVAG